MMTKKCDPKFFNEFLAIYSMSIDFYNILHTNS